MLRTTPDPMAVRAFRSSDRPVKSFIRRFKCLCNWESHVKVKCLYMSDFIILSENSLVTKLVILPFFQYISFWVLWVTKWVHFVFRLVKVKSLSELCLLSRESFNQVLYLLVSKNSLSLQTLKPRPIVELFMRRIKLSELRRLAQLSSSEWVWIEQIDRMSQDRLQDKRRSSHATNYTNKVIICTLCDDVYLASFGRKLIMAGWNCYFVWFRWLVRPVVSSTSDSTDDLNAI